MPSIVLRDVPENVKLEIEQRAAENRRSMAQETLYIIERALPFLRPVQMPKRRAKVNGEPLSNAEVLKAIKSGRR